MRQEIENYIKELEAGYEESTAEKNQLANAQMSMFDTPNEENLIRWQLDLKEDMNRIYHLLKGHQPYEKEDGSVGYKEPEDESLMPLNDQGVNLVMNIMSFYLVRNTLLSNFSADDIDLKCKQFSSALIDVIYEKYEEMGMDTPDKIKMYEMIVLALVDAVHSALMRAYKAGERDSLRTARTVTQSEPIGMNMPGSRPSDKSRKFSPFKPSTWM